MFQSAHDVALNLRCKDIRANKIIRLGLFLFLITIGCALLLSSNVRPLELHAFTHSASIDTCCTKQHNSFPPLSSKKVTRLISPLACRELRGCCCCYPL